jgi:MarR family transcriptional regulator, organic hydroperoxide resistance regulator
MDGASSLQGFVSMKSASKTNAVATSKNRSKNEAGVSPDQTLPFEDSVGYQVRFTHWLIQRYLQQQIEPYGITTGMWYFLRALWHQDGQTQRELSMRVGTMEPTTLIAIKAMEAASLVTRVRNAQDRRKINIFLTRRGRELRHKLLPLAKAVVDDAIEGFSASERKAFFKSLSTVQKNLKAKLGDDLSGDGD